MLDVRKGKPSASDAEANELCPGRHAMSLGMKDQPTPQSLTGDKIHQWLFDPTSVELEGYDRVIAGKCLQQREALMDLMWDDWRRNPPKIIQEDRLWYRQEKFSGVPDYVAIRDGLCLVADYKTGPIKVKNAADNRQLMWLAVLVNSKYKVKEITASIIQPPCGPPTSHTYDKTALVKARNKVNSVLRKMNDGAAFLRAGEKQCKYCKAKELCPALQNKATAITRVRDVEALTPIQLSEAMDVIGPIKAMCGAIEERVRLMLEEHPQAVPTYELVAGRTTKTVKDPQQAAQRLLLDGLVSDSGLMQSASISIPKLIKQVGEYREISPAEAKKEVNTCLHDLIEEKEGRAKLCRRES
tara:strand:- start:603 stop:1670 length:1068 start_codon:yes stop_codon:yes gene_type:complete